MLLNTLWHRTVPTTKEISDSNVNSAAVEKLLIGIVNWKQWGESEESKKKVFQDDKQ